MISIQLRAQQMVILHKKDKEKYRKQSSYQAHTPRAVCQEKIKGQGEELVAAFC